VAVATRRRKAFALMGGLALLIGAACSSFGTGSSSSSSDDADSSVGDDGGPTPVRCATLSRIPKLCDDFDHGEGFLVRWGNYDSTQTPEGGAIEKGDAGLEITSKYAVSPPSSFHVFLREGHRSCAYARLVKIFTQPYSRLRLSHAVRVGNDTGQILGQSNIWEIGATSYATFYLDIGPDGVAKMHEQYMDTVGQRRDVFHNLPNVLGGRWMRVTTEIDLATSKMRVEYNDQLVLDQQLETPPRSTPADEVLLGIGNACMPPGGSFDLHFDDVVFDFD